MQRIATFLFTFLFAFVIGFAAATAAASEPDQPGFNLPRLGVAGGVALPLWKAHIIGQQVYYQIERADGVMNDPLVAGYINYLGHRLSSVAGGPNEPFLYFVVKSPAINAFTLPGAFIGINAGLILATRNEDELAGVMAHETAHAVLRHIARGMAAAPFERLVDIAMLIGALAIGVANPDLAIGALMSAQGGAVQRQINYTRADEYAADRVGITILARARFAPEGMVRFFQLMQRNYAFNGYQIPQFLSTHPLDLTRISEAENRARNLHIKPLPEDKNYALMRARIRVLLSKDLYATLKYFRTQAHFQSNPWYRKAAIYGAVLCLIRLDKGQRALRRITPLAKTYPNILALQLARARALLSAGKTRTGLRELASINNLFSGNRAAAMSYAQALLNHDQPQKAARVLDPLVYRNPDGYDPGLYHLLATAANHTGNKTLSYIAMADYFAARGQYKSGIIQLDFAKRRPGLDPVLKERIRLRRQALEKAKKEARKLGFDQSKSK